MTSGAPLPDRLRRWVHGHVREYVRAEDTSWDRPDSQVWHLTGGHTDTYLKIAATDWAYAREIHGYRHAAAVLGDRETPRLLAADHDLRTILISALPGMIVKNARPAIAQEERIHQRAGELLRRWHDAPSPMTTAITTSDRARVRKTVGQQVERAAYLADQLAWPPEMITAGWRALVADALGELPVLARDLTVRYRHGDFAPRNWLWDPATDQVALLDYEKSTLGIGIEDLVWLRATTWTPRPELRHQFLAGYGRDLEIDEAAAIDAFAALGALSYLDAGIRQRREELVSKATRAFHALTGNRVATATDVAADPECAQRPVQSGRHEPKGTR